MPTIIDLGQKVKAKYPGVYDDLSDLEVGEKVKAKYPGSYDDFTDVKDSIPKKVFNFVKEGVKSLGNTAVRSYVQTNPVLRPLAQSKILPEEVNLPIVGKTSLRYSGDTKKALGQAGEDALNAFTPGLTKAGGTVVKGTGEALFKSAITPTVQEAERILAYKAKVPFLKRVENYFVGAASKEKPLLRSDTALQTKGIFGTESGVGIKAKRAADDLWKTKIAPAVEASKEVVTKDELFSPVRKLIGGTTDPSRRNALIDAFEALEDDYKGITKFTLKSAQKLKSEIDKFTPEKLFRGKNVANEFRVLQNEMANVIREKTYTALKDQNIRKAYLDWANLHELQKIGVRAISEAKLKGGFGSFWTGMYDMTTVPIKTIGGQVLYRVGNALEFLGKKGITKFGAFLASHGFKKPED